MSNALNRFTTLTPQFSKKVPANDDRTRNVCDHCGFVAYSNPKIVAGCIATTKDNKSILLCKRDIEPRKGYWCLPCGFIESGESPDGGAIREAKEEANANIVLGKLISVYSVPYIDQIMMYYRAIIENPNEIQALDETQDVKLFEYKDIPWDDIAFSANIKALEYWIDHANDDSVDTFTFSEEA